jgi:hypothetical protein
MPSFADTGRSAAPIDEVWKRLSDPKRLPEWWAGAARPELPLPELTPSAEQGRRVAISCLVSGMNFEWRLETEGDGTRIDVLVDVPENEALTLDQQRELTRRSLVRLAEVATAAPL